MSQSTSVYAVTESEPPKWKPGEETAAAAFMGIAFWVIVDTLFCINRVFKKKRGLYFWAMLIGISTCFVDGVGVVLKYLTPNSEHLWGLYTILLLGGWACYAPAQLLVLYSRLHLINDVEWIRKVIFYTILSTYITFILPTWVCNWQSYNPDPKISSLWSPRTAIVERITQIGFTLVEMMVSGVYIWSLLRILQSKVTVRQRRVMLDLIYVNLIICAFDILTVIFIYMNELGISHPIQTFSYTLKFKLEFLVLNQLMAVAARGIQKRSWEEKRYHDANIPDGFSAEARRWDHPMAGEPDTSAANPTGSAQDLIDNPPGYTALREGLKSPEHSPGPAVPRPSHPRHSAHDTSSRSSAINPANPRSYDFPPGPALDLRNSLVEPNTQSEHRPSDPQSEQPSIAYSGSTLNPGPHEPREESPHLFPRNLQRRKRRTMEIIREHVSGHANRDRDRRPPSGTPRSQRSQWSQRSHLDFNPNMPYNATLRRPNPRKQSAADDEDSEEEMGVHMWERKGTILLCAPWMDRHEAQAERIKQGV